MSANLPAGVTTESTDETVSASTTVAASPSEVFDYIRAPRNHAAISGDDTVQDNITGPELLAAGGTFRMKMTRGPLHYRITNKVVEFDQDKVIAWRHFAGHRWRWAVETDGAGGTLLTETYDQSKARIPLVERSMGYPKRHEANVANSVANVAAHFAGRSG